MFPWSKQNTVQRHLVGVRGWGGSVERHVTSFPPLFFFFLCWHGSWDMCVGEGELISWRSSLFLFFPKDQGQEESTPRVVGGKRNNKAHERLGTTTWLTSSAIVSLAVLVIYLKPSWHLHCTWPSPSQTSLPSGRWLACWLSLPWSLSLSLSHCPFLLPLPFLLFSCILCLSFFLSLFMLMFTGPGKKKEEKGWISHHFFPSRSTHRRLVNDEAPGRGRQETREEKRAPFLCNK